MIKKNKSLNFLYLLPICIVLISGFVIAEQTVKSIDLPLAYLDYSQPNTVYTRNLTIDTPDGITEIISLEMIMSGDFLASTTVQGGFLVNEQVVFCNPNSWVTPPWNVANYEMSFDCTDKVVDSGWKGDKDKLIHFAWKNTKIAGNFKPRLHMTYYNKPSTSMRFFGTDYRPTDNGTIFLQLLDDNKHAIDDASCFLSSWYPDKTFFLNNVVTSYLTEGLYYYDFTVPNQHGIYMLSATCYRPSTAYVDEFIDDSGVGYYSNITIFLDKLYLQGYELPNNQTTQNSINMSENVLLYHLNKNTDFSENDTHIHDFSNNSNYGVVLGASYTTMSKLGKGAYDFDGTDDLINVSNHPTIYFNTTGNYTWSAWVKPNNIVDFVDNGVWFSKGLNGTSGYMFGHAGDDLCVGVYSAGLGGVALQCANNVMTTSWQHVVLTYSNGTKKLYHNGISVINLSAPPSAMAATSDFTNDLYIGRSDILLGPLMPQPIYMNGSLDELAIWNKVLNHNEIYNIYIRTLKNGTGTTKGYVESNLLNLTMDYWLIFDAEYDEKDGEINFSILDENNNTICNNLGNVKLCANTTSPIKLRADMNRQNDSITSPEIDRWYITWAGGNYTIEQIKGSGEINVLSWVNSDGTVNVGDINVTAVINASELNITIDLSNITDQLDIIKSMINNTNSTLFIEINENEADIAVVNNTVNLIYDYVQNNITFNTTELLNLLNEINLTTHSIDNYLQTTIYNKLVTLEAKLNDTLQNQTTIWNKLVEIQQNSTEIMAEIDVLKAMVQNVNITLINEINENEAKLDIIDTVVDTILDKINNTIEPSLNSIQSNITEMQTKLDTINTDLYNLSQDVNEIQNSVSYLNDSIDDMRSNFSIRFDTLDTTLTNISTEVGYIEAKLDCNHTQNIICDKLDNIVIDIDSINQTVDNIESYLLINITSDLLEIYNIAYDVNITVYDINSTVTAIYSYLQNTIYPEIDQVEEDLNDVLNNQTNIWLKLIDIQQNITENYNELNNIENLIGNINNSLTIEINENEQKLVDLNNSVNLIINYITTQVIPLLNTTVTEINDIQIDIEILKNYTDTLENGQQTINNSINLLQTYILDLNISVFDLSHDFQNLNSSIQSRFDSVDNNLSVIFTEVQNIENKLDCNHTVNIVCDKIDAISNSIQLINVTVEEIEDYLLNEVTNHLGDINSTVYKNYYAILDTNGTVTNVLSVVNNINSSVNNISLDTGRISDVYNILNKSIQFKTYSTSRVVATHQYAIKTTFVDLNGKYVVPDSVPKISLYDPDNNQIVINVSMTSFGGGVYGYNYSTAAVSTTGNWYVIIDAIYNNHTFKQYDYWTLIANPTQIQVEIVSACDIVCADISIENEGTTPYEYIYYWWGTDNALDDYDAEDVFDRGQASKLIKPGETFVTRRCLNNPETEKQSYFRTKVYYGEYSYATDSWDDRFNCAGHGVDDLITGAAVKILPDEIAANIADLIYLFVTPFKNGINKIWERMGFVGMFIFILTLCSIFMILIVGKQKRNIIIVRRRYKL